MTIDEIKVRLINLMKPIRINLMGTEIKIRQEEPYPYLKPIFEALECAIDCLEELKWYREQDLIRREDVIKRCDCNYEKDSCIRIKFADNCENCYWHTVKSRDIKQIPKAEPPVKAIYSDKPIIVHNKEDWDRFQADINGCKTCRHDETGDGYCRDCGTTVNHYELCVSEG